MLPDLKLIAILVFCTLYSYCSLVFLGFFVASMAYDHENFALNFFQIPDDGAKNHPCPPPAESSDSSSVSTSDEQQSLVSDAESSVSGSAGEQTPLFSVRLSQGDAAHDLIKSRFLSGLGPLGKHVEILGIRRNGFSGDTWQARLQSFQIFLRATERKCGGDANVKYAWYACSQEDARRIMEHGFGRCGLAEDNGFYGSGVYFTPDYLPLEGVKNSVPDRNGQRHLLLCRVILGKTEVVQPQPGGSAQSHPSYVEFDSGVDNFSKPHKYVVWSTHMNTHILPEFLLSFRSPSLPEFLRMQGNLSKPTSPWMPFPSLISALSKFLPPSSIALISKYHKAHKERKLPRRELIKHVREIAGDRLLIALIKSFRAE